MGMRLAVVFVCFDSSPELRDSIRTHAGPNSTSDGPMADRHQFTRAALGGLSF